MRPPLPVLTLEKMVVLWMFLPLETASRLTLHLYPGKGSLAVAQEEHQP